MQALGVTSFCRGLDAFWKLRRRSFSQHDSCIFSGEAVIVANGNSFSPQEDRAGRRAFSLQNGSADSIEEVRISVLSLQPHLSLCPRLHVKTKLPT